MKRILPLAIAFFIPVCLHAQVQFDKHSFSVERKGTVTVSEINNDFFPELQRLEMPLPGGIEKPALRADQPEPHNTGATPQNAALTNLGLGKNFVGNGWANSTPNDNDLAISNGGKIISVINSTMYYYDVIADSSLGTVSYSAFTVPLGLPHDEFDPKVIYDPNTDRFITVCLNGFTDSTSNVIIGFSQTNDPTGAWNLYALPGDPLANDLWTDYPMISLTEDELFLTANLLYNDSSWQTGFVETLIWQINKQDGYDGVTLNTNLLNNIKFNGRSIRNLCPAKGGSMLYGPEMYFVSNRNFQAQSDTIFLVKTTDTIGAPGFNIEIKQMNSNADYFMAGDARQFGTHKFATNDSRVLGAFYENGMVQFVQNCKDTASGFTGLYHGVISNLSATTPTVAGQVIADDSLDLGYPNISYAGNSSSDNSAIITFNHSSPDVYAGCSAIKTDAAGNYSAIMKIVDGTSYVNLLGSPVERWGDYSGSQRRYNKPGEVWMSGYYGYYSSFNRKHAAYIGQILIDEQLAPVPVTEENTAAVKVFPNPVPEFVQVEIQLAEATYLNFELYDSKGTLIQVLMREFVKPGKNLFTFTMQHMPAGSYMLRIYDKQKEVNLTKIIRQ